jgi:phage gp29-like protein
MRKNHGGNRPSAQRSAPRVADNASVHINGVNQDLSPPNILKPGDRDFNYAGAYEGIYAPSLRYPQFSLDRLLSQHGYGYVEDMLYMAACRSPFDLKRYAVLQDGWDIVPAQADPKHPDHECAKKLADEVRYALQNIRDEVTDFTQDCASVLFELMYGAWTGNKVMEIDWQYCTHGRLKGKQTFRGFYAKTNRQMAFDVDPRTMALKNFTSYTPGGGYDFTIPVEKCLYYVHNQTSNIPAGNGDWRASHKHWKRLDANLMVWAMALERWGSPVFIVQYPGGNANELAGCRQALDAIRQGAAAIIPENVKYEVVTAPQQVFIGFEQSCRYDAEQIAINVVGNTLTTGAGENSLALGQVHQVTGATYDDALSERICANFQQQVIRRYIRYNYGEDACDLCPKLRLKKRLEGDQVKLAQMIQILVESGNMPSQSAVIRDTLNLPAISPEEDVMLEAEKQAIAEAQAQIAAGRSPSKVMKMADYKFDPDKWVADIANVIYHTQLLPKLQAKFREEAEKPTPMEIRAIEGS